MRGWRRMDDPRVVGAQVGTSGGAAFVLVNAGELPGWLTTASLIAGAVALVACLASVLVLERPWPPLPAPRARAGRVYAAAVLGMVVLILLSARVLVALDRDDLVPAAVVAAVGLHFVPFAGAFRAPVFRVLGWTLTGIGVAALLLGLTWREAAAPGGAVLAGLAMLVLIAVDSRRVRSGAEVAAPAATPAHDAGVRTGRPRRPSPG